MGTQTPHIQKAYNLACLLLILINFAISLPLSIVISKKLANVFMGLGNMDVLSSAIPLSYNGYCCRCFWTDLNDERSSF